MTTSILTGDCLEVLKTMPDRSVHCCITSPPYWGLRSYLPANHPHKHLEIGSEPTVEEWVHKLVVIFREVRRVLRNDGTLWLNVGDSYAGSRCGGATGATSTIHGGIEHQAQSKVAKQMIKKRAARAPAPGAAQ